MEPDSLSNPDWSVDYSNNDLLKQLDDYALKSNYTFPQTSAAPNTGIGDLTSAGTWSITPINNHTVINGPVQAGEMSVSDGAGGWIKVGEALRTIMDRLAILQPDLEKMERYPALKAAYDNYKIMEALLNDEVAGGK